MAEYGRHVYFCLNDWVAKVNPSDGEVLWKYRLFQSSYLCPMTAHGGMAFLSTTISTDTGNQPHLVALGENGEEQWKVPLWGAPEVPVAVLEGVLYLSAWQEVLAVGGGNGEIIWRTKVDSLAWSPVVKGGLVIATDKAGFVYGLERSSGEMVWKLRLGEPIVKEEIINGRKQTNVMWPIGRPYLHQDTVFVGHADGTLTALSLQGEKEWSLKLQGRLLLGGVSAFKGDRDAIYVATTYLYDPAEGGFLYKILLPQNE